MSKFQHSVKVPRLYKDSAKILKSVKEGGSLKDLLGKHNKFSNINGIHALVCESIKYDKILTRILNLTNILNIERFDVFLAKILLTELIFGKKRLSGNSKPIVTLLKYKEEIEKYYQEADVYKISSNLKKNTKDLKPRYVRVNTLKISLEEVIANFKDGEWEELECPPSYDDYLKLIKNRMFGQEYVFVRDFHVKNLLVFPSKIVFYDHPAYLEKYIILQDKASCILSCCLNIKPGSTILDMCAAPGMKTSLLASLIENQGKIYAVEMNNERFDVMNKLLEEYGVNCVETINSDAGLVGPKYCKDVKYILVDPSCSGSGMTSRVEDIEVNSGGGITHQYKSRLQKLSNVQSYLLRHALSNFPTAKYVIYFTCSLNDIENEGVVDSAMVCAKMNGYTLMDLRKKVNGWKEFGSNKYQCGSKCIYTRPETDYINGGFLTIFKRKSENDISLLNTVFNEDETEQLVNNYKINLKEQFFLYVNTLKISIDDAIQRFVNNGWKCSQSSSNYDVFLPSVQEDFKDDLQNFQQDSLIKELLIFPKGIVSNALAEKYIKKRKFFLQDKVNCLTIHLLDPVAGSSVLDLNAGLQKISLCIATRMNDNGVVYAYEPNETQFNSLNRDLKKSCVSCVQLKCESGFSSNADNCPNVNFILVNPPCTGTGTEFSENLCSIQFSLLKRALTTYPETQRIVYMTRSVNPEENEDIINAALVIAKFNHFRLIDASSRVEDWINECSTKYHWSSSCILSRKKKSSEMGVFIAVFERFKAHYDVITKQNNVKEKISFNKSITLEDSFSKKSTKRFVKNEINSFSNNEYFEELPSVHDNELQVSCNYKNVKRKKYNDVLENNHSDEDSLKKKKREQCNSYDS